MKRLTDSASLCLSLVVQAALLGPLGAERASELQRLNVGDFRLYHTGHEPGSLHYRGKPLIQRIYFYTAVKDAGGKTIEGFNFRRNEDGFLTFDKQEIDGGYRLTWKNKKYVYERNTRKTDKLAGEATVTLTITREEFSLRYQGKIEPNEGFGEIGFYVSEDALTGDADATYTAQLAGGKEQTGTFPLGDEQPRNILHGFSSLQVQSMQADYAFTFAGTDFPGSNGLHFQDFRKQDTSPGCYRVVLGIGTKSGNEFDYSWRLRVTPKDGDTVAAPHVVAPHVAAPAEGVDAPARPVQRIPQFPAELGEARPVPPRQAAPTPGAKLQADLSETGRISLNDGDQSLVQGEYFQLFATGTPQRKDTQDGDIHRTTFRFDAPKGTLVKEAVVSPDEAWLLWTVKAKEQLRGEVGFYCPAEVFTAPCLTYRSINQSMVQETDKPELSSSYCILAGGERDWRELQCGTGAHGDWQFQDFTERGNRYRFVAVPSLKPGQEWRAAFRYVRRSAEPYPAVSFDQAREERGILATLLPDAIEDGFTIVPARSAKYAFTDEPLTIRMKYYALDRQSRTVDLDCRLVDMWGREVGEKSYALKNDGQRFAALEFPVAVGANGAYRMEINYSAGDVSRTRELIFTVMPEIADTGFRPDSVFGAALGYGDYLGTLAKRIGLKWNRCHCAIGDTQCGLVQPERGQYTWDRLDQACDFHDKYQFFPCHSVSEGWRAPWLSAMWKEQPFEEYLRAYVDEYVKPLAQQYKGRIKCWEVTNEPYYQFKDCPEKWVQLMKETYEALKEVDPDCFVVGTCGPPGSMGYSWYRRTFELGSLNYQDAVSSHLYHFGPWVGSGLAMTVRKWMHEIRSIMKEHGKVVPLWNSETTVSPPASMYTHPSHTRYCRYHPGESPTDPIEQSQVYFKVLVVHKAEDVKYSFHIFHGGVEYTSHTGEYDETPLAFLATQATLAKHLEEAEYLEDLQLHEDVQCFLFRKGRQLIAIPWGPMFLKNDRADIVLPIPADRFTARDVFDNPLPVEGDDKETRLAVSWEGFYLLTDQVSVEELKSAVSKAAVNVRFADDTDRTIKGTFMGEGAGPAKRSDWVGFHPIDLSRVANRSFTDEEPEDGKGGWTDEGQNDMRFLPVGDWITNGVPFRILDPAKSDDKSCIVLKGGMNPDAPFPPTVSIPVGQRLSKLHFLHTVAWGSSRKAKAFTYVLHYTDGFEEEVEVYDRVSVANWWDLGTLPEAKVGWEGPNPVRQKVRLWHAQHEITHPKGAQAVLDRIEIVSECKRPIPVVVAITGVYSN